MIRTPRLMRTRIGVTFGARVATTAAPTAEAASAAVMP